MDMSGERLIAVDKAKLWDALNDPAILQASIPGCESFEKLSATEMKAAIAIKIGSVAAKFTGKLLISDLNSPNGYTISSEDQDSGSGSATINLADAEHGTKLAYKINAAPSGEIAALDPAQLEAAISRDIEEFFSRLAAILSPPAPSLADTGIAESPYHGLAEDHDHDPSNPHYFGLPIGVIIAASVATISVGLTLFKFVAH